MSIHATCVSVNGIGVLFLGPSGAGKSDLALRLIDEPGQGIGDQVLETSLVADDQVTVTLDADNQPWASAPEPLKGLLEIRGAGIVEVRPSEPVVVKLAVVFTAQEDIERMPGDNTNTADICGIKLPQIALDPTTQSAPARVRAAVCALQNGELKTVQSI